MKDLQQLGITEKDFNMMIEALDNLPNKDLSSDLIMGLVGFMISDGDEEMQMKIKEDRDKKKAIKEMERKMIEEDISLLKAKLISMKRLMIENNLIKTAKDLI